MISNVGTVAIYNKNKQKYYAQTACWVVSLVTTLIKSVEKRAMRERERERERLKGFGRLKETEANSWEK